MVDVSFKTKVEKCMQCISSVGKRCLCSKLCDETSFSVTRSGSIERPSRRASKLVRIQKAPADKPDASPNSKACCHRSICYRHYCQSRRILFSFASASVANDSSRKRLPYRRRCRQEHCRSRSSNSFFAVLGVRHDASVTDRRGRVRAFLA